MGFKNEEPLWKKIRSMTEIIWKGRRDRCESCMNDETRLTTTGGS